MNIQELTTNRVSLGYPNIVIMRPNQTLPVTIQSLESGPIQLIMEFKGQRKVVKSISPSAFNIDKLLRTLGSITYNLDSAISKEIYSVEEYMRLV